MGPPAAIVLAGGAEAPPDPVRLPAPATVIAADSGYELAAALGLTVDRIVGDLDSLSPSARDAADRSAIPIDVHPADKDATDLELAMRAAVALDPSEIVIVGGFGGRLDHLLGNALLLAAAFLGEVPVRWEGPGSTIHRVTRGSGCVVTGRPGELVSLLPLAGAVAGIATEGLHWRLDGEPLAPGSTRGLSNRLTTGKASVRVGSGVLIVIHQRGPTP